jgi:UPF0755 protein
MARRRTKGRKKTGSGAVRLFLAAVFALLVAAGAGYWLIFLPFGPMSEVFVQIAPRSNTLQIGQQLEAAGVVRSQYGFDLMRIGKRGTLRAGEYRFDHPASIDEVYARILRGDVYTLTVTIPEGASIFEIGSRLEQAGLGTRQQFLDAARLEQGLVGDLDHEATSLEGYLFPDTYHFPRKATDAQICATMVRRFRAVATQVGLHGNMHKTVTVASLVERESAVEAERPLVASVFYNRLARAMPLMTDPSVIYGLELDGRWKGKIYQSDLKLDTPYNTYLHAGLPPGPVANPGARALRAAMQPAHTDYLYFVAAGADPQGHSLFSRTLDEQSHNVAGYRRAVKKAGAQ